MKLRPKIEKNIDFEQAYSKAAALCSRAEKCKHEIRQKLIQWKLDSGEITGVLEKLEQENFINETRFAEAYVNDKIKFNYWGKTKIIYMLKSLKINQQDISNAISKIDNNEYLLLAKNLIQEKSRLFKDENEFKNKQKIVNYMVSKGFETEIVFKLLNL